MMIRDNALFSNKNSATPKEALVADHPYWKALPLLSARQSNEQILDYVTTFRR